MKILDGLKWSALSVVKQLSAGLTNMFNEFNHIARIAQTQIGERIDAEQETEQVDESHALPGKPDGEMN